ncbi:MAG: GTP cyclohydrolase I FolE [Candidatus Firestonebacteria bacterium GWA2_43_8]|nr:MAG: GTP cyclohydrolase I FolE [Candidatus Firestonebacteria bacterium GWA2_43_8]
MNKAKIEKAVRDILIAIGEDPEREGLQGTPERVARMYEEIFQGVKMDPTKELKVLFTEEHDEMVLLKDIPFYSMCEHHLLPFIGKAHVAYIPVNNKVLGLSKIARLVDTVSKRPQLQERLTSLIADTLTKTIKPKGVLVVVEAEHLCMTMRGIKKPGSKMVTSAVRGLFRKSQATRSEALALIRGS